MYWHYTCSPQWLFEKCLLMTIKAFAKIWLNETYCLKFVFPFFCKNVNTLYLNIVDIYIVSKKKIHASWRHIPLLENLAKKFGFWNPCKDKYVYTKSSFLSLLELVQKHCSQIYVQFLLYKVAIMDFTKSYTSKENWMWYKNVLLSNWNYLSNSLSSVFNIH